MRMRLVLIVVPLALLPLPLSVPTPAGKCAYGIMIMAFYWMTEAIPMAVTALLPIVIFPWLSVLDTKKVCENYFKDANMLFFGGLMVAVAVEKWNLHKRIALRVLMLVGSKPCWLFFGFMSTTAFLSMWISNTATTAMMIPIAQAVLNELESHIKKAKGVKKNLRNDDKINRWFEEVGKGMRLSIAYAANIGGTATLTGTGPNLVLKGQLDVSGETGSGINFSSWFVFAFPNMILSLFLAWLWLMLLFLGFNDVIKKEYAKLGKMSFAEAVILLLFILLALLWLTRHPEFVPGWGSLLVPFGWVTDSCVAVTVAVLLFMLPSRCPSFLRFNCRRAQNKKRGDVEINIVPALLDWPTVHSNIPWNVLLLLGGGFAMAEACKESGLSQVIGQFFISLNYLPRWGLVFILSTLTAGFTEVTSNVATATIFLPILAQLATTLSINPLYLMVPVTISASFAFMLPVATPPNAIVFAYGKMKILDMMKAGIIQNVVCLLTLQLAINTWGRAYFNLDQFPDWAGCGFKCTSNFTETFTIGPESRDFVNVFYKRQQ
ncbi:hypothetical protein HELRODRAFT_157200 [Helobdella robusta]|uniref:Citrate transporter-like domain-containing protein n=1 Tax=Helobdella robusta TaxID=6412 RepID=T1EM80_HELRO|nr:hypothetical protein HELRODRAFT_157200 [Helobdella robusta]ESO01619.1 hypothetical protein HELRODRAFT_157200 [Helobdella robusta]